MSNKVTFFYDQQLEQASNTVRIRNTGKNKGEEIMRAFFIDDFHLTLSNQWSTGDSTIVKGLVDAAQNFVTSRTGRTVSHYLKKSIDAVTSRMDKSDEGYKLLGNLKGGLETLSGYQNSTFFTADDFYKTFKGTTVTFPISLSISLVSDSMTEDIFDRLKKLLSVSIGDYSTFLTFIGIQGAPNGFESGGYNITSTEEIKGSVNVIYGDPDFGGFTLTNMLIANIHCTFSKTRVKILDSEGSEVYRPLYIDINVMLEPAKKFTKDDLYANLNLGPVENSKVPTRIEPANGSSPKDEEEEAKIRAAEAGRVRQKQTEESLNKTLKEYSKFTSLPAGVNTSIALKDGVATLSLISPQSSKEASDFFLYSTGNSSSPGPGSFLDLLKKSIPKDIKVKTDVKIINPDYLGAGQYF